MVREKLIHDDLHPCPYLPERTARTPMYRQLTRLSPEETDRRHAGSERRVGAALYRAQCPACEACRGLRIPVQDFSPSKSQRRVLKRWEEAGGRVEAHVPGWSPSKIRLFNKHKQDRGLSQREDAFSPVGYVSWLIQTCTQTTELQYWVGTRLVGVSILDLGERSASSVYFFFDPDPRLARLSPGTLSVLHEVERCREAGRAYYYLGLHVEGNAHMAYKTSFRPYEIQIHGEWVRRNEAEIHPHQSP